MVGRPGNEATGWHEQVLVFSENVEEHIEHLRQVFSHLCEVGLKLYPQKCVLGYLRCVT